MNPIPPHTLPTSHLEANVYVSSFNLREKNNEIALKPAETAIPTRISLMGSKPFDRSLVSKIIRNAANTPPPNVNNGINIDAFSLIE